MVHVMRPFGRLKQAKKAKLGWNHADMVKQLDDMRITKCSHIFALVAHMQILDRLMFGSMLSYCRL